MNWLLSTLQEVSVKEDTLSELTKEVDVNQIDMAELDKSFFKADNSHLEALETSFEHREILDIKESRTEIEVTEKTILTERDKLQIKEETGWSDEIVEAIGCTQEYEIYKNAGLQEVEINGKKCLSQPMIDMEQKDSMGRSNKERMELGLAPLNKENKTIELHHIGQHSDSPLAELTMEQHRGKGNDTILHDKTKESEIDRNKFNIEKANYWKCRAGGVGENDGYH